MSLGWVFKIRVVTTEKAEHFFRRKDLGKVDVFCDKDEWKGWSKRGDDILHIELGKWGDILLLVPLDANSLGKIGVVRRVISFNAKIAYSITISGHL